MRQYYQRSHFKQQKCCSLTALASLVARLVKNPPAMRETWVGKIPWRREKLPFQYSGLENSMDCIVHGVAKSQTQVSNFHFHGSAGRSPKSRCQQGYAPPKVLGKNPSCLFQRPQENPVAAYPQFLPPVSQGHLCVCVLFSYKDPGHSISRMISSQGS